MKLKCLSLTEDDSSPINPSGICAGYRRMAIGHIREAEWPKHFQVSYGRHIFRVLHLDTSAAFERPHIWPRDFALDLHAYPHGVTAYLAECERTGIQPEPQFIPAAA